MLLLTDHLNICCRLAEKLCNRKSAMSLYVSAGCSGSSFSRDCQTPDSCNTRFLPNKQCGLEPGGHDMGHARLQEPM